MIHLLVVLLQESGKEDSGREHHIELQYSNSHNLENAPNIFKTKVFNYFQVFFPSSLRKSLLGKNS